MATTKHSRLTVNVLKTVLVMCAVGLMLTACNVWAQTDRCRYCIPLTPAPLQTMPRSTIINDGRNIWFVTESARSPGNPTTTYNVLGSPTNDRPFPGIITPQSGQYNPLTGRIDP